MSIGTSILSAMVPATDPPSSSSSDRRPAPPASPAPASVLLLGSTGLVGSAALGLLLRSSRVSRVMAPVRRALHPPHPKLQSPEGDLLALPPEALGCEVVMSALGTTRRKAGSAEGFRKIDYDLVLELLSRARKAGARHAVLVSSVGAEANSPFLYPRTKGELERDVAALGFEHVDILRPSLLLGDRTEPRPSEHLATLLSRPLSALLKGPLARYRPIEARQVAQAMAACLDRPPLKTVELHEGTSLFRLASRLDGRPQIGPD